VKRSKDAGEQESDGGISPLLFQKLLGRRCLFHYGIVVNFIVWQGRIETNLLQQKKSEK